MNNFFNDKEFNDFINQFFKNNQFDSSYFFGVPKTDSGKNEFGDWMKKTYTSKDGNIKIVNFYQTNSEKFDSDDEISQLKNDLNKSVESQDFETAVILRDKIKNLENNKNEIEKLEKELKVTIDTQEFEKSIKLRDKINKLKSNKV